MFIRSACIFAVLLAQNATAANSCLPAATFKQVNDLLARKSYQEAAHALELLQTCPQLSPLETFEMGWLYGRARRFDAALKVFNRVPGDVPDRPTHDYAVALSEFELADYHGAVTVLEALRSTGALDAKSANLLAVSYSKLALYKQAYGVLEEQVASGSKDLSTYLNLVTVCAEGGDFARAAEVASNAVKLFPDSADALNVRGAAYSLLGHLGQASQDFAAAEHLAPNRPDIRFFLALMDYNQAKYPQALAVLQTAKQEGMKDSDLSYLTAECLLKVDSASSKAALAELNQAIDLNPDSVAARTLRGRLLLDGGQTKAAAADLEIANRQDPSSRSTLYNLARAYRALGENDRAATFFRKLHSDQPSILKEAGDRRLNETLAGKGTAP